MDSLDDDFSDDDDIVDEREARNMLSANHQTQKLWSNLDTNTKPFDASTQNPDMGNSRLETFSRYYRRGFVGNKVFVVQKVKERIIGFHHLV